MVILVVNSGSSGLKLRVLAPDDRLMAAADLARPEGAVGRAELGARIGSFSGIDVVGHRVVHGGSRFSGPVRVDAEVRAALEELVDLAPLHQPGSLAALDAVGALLPGVPAVACFDTAFHAGLPPAASTYALPAEWRRRFGLRRYGFHGLSHAYVARRTAELAGVGQTAMRVVSCHLGAGASLAAIVGGRSVDTTMGFTPIEGLVMATRSGSVDPGLVLWLEEHARTPPSALADALEHRSGLVALAGTARMEEVLERARGGDRTAGLALDVYVHRLRAQIAAMAAAMGGLDALVFTGGVGEHAPQVRALACDGLGFLGVGIDPAANGGAVADAEIGAPGRPVRTFVVTAREDLEIAREVRGVFAAV